MTESDFKRDTQSAKTWMDGIVGLSVGRQEGNRRRDHWMDGVLEGHDGSHAD